jgi:hypothetical protein
MRLECRITDEVLERQSPERHVSLRAGRGTRGVARDWGDAFDESGRGRRHGNLASRRPGGADGGLFIEREAIDGMAGGVGEAPGDMDVAIAPQYVVLHLPELGGGARRAGIVGLAGGRGPGEEVAERLDLGHVGLP